jgi:hypothetical protein
LELARVDFAAYRSAAAAQLNPEALDGLGSKSRGSIML